MTRQLKDTADSRLDQAAAERGYADPRPALRDRLRQLKENQPEAFEAARQHYAESVIPALASASDPLADWVAYARYLGERSAPGRLVAIDAGGSARPYSAPEAGLLILFIPDDTAVPVLLAAGPAAPSAAQRATLELLVHRKLSL